MLKLRREVKKRKLTLIRLFFYFDLAKYLLHYNNITKLNLGE